MRFNKGLSAAGVNPHMSGRPPRKILRTALFCLLIVFIFRVSLAPPDPPKSGQAQPLPDARDANLAQSQQLPPAHNADPSQLAAVDGTPPPIPDSAEENVSLAQLQAERTGSTPASPESHEGSAGLPTSPAARHETPSSVPEATDGENAGLARLAWPAADTPSVSPECDREKVGLGRLPANELNGQFAGLTGNAVSPGPWQSLVDGEDPAPDAPVSDFYETDLFHLSALGLDSQLADRVLEEMNGLLSRLAALSPEGMDGLPIPGLQPDGFELAPPAGSAEGDSEKRYVVQPGDTLGQVCEKFGVPAERLGEWREAFADFKEVARLMPGDEFVFHCPVPSEEPVKLVYAPQNDPVTITFTKGEKGWECIREDIELETTARAVAGTISGSLFASATEAGLPARVVLDLADLFAYDVDFSSDIQPGDTFGVYIEEQTAGDKAMGGRILAAEMHVGGSRSRAFYYELPDGYKGYFDENGDSLVKMFLKSPLSYSRISSTFTHARRHPILKTVRPHLGIDYAAPTGTPVSSLASGTVTFVGRKGGFGLYVEVRHDATYKTGYGHLSRFAKGLRAGKKVAQGDVIGYVGSTGLATGPHLDFRFFKNGQPVDFLKTDFPRARSIPKSLRADFANKRRLYLAEIRNASARGRLATAEELKDRRAEGKRVRRSEG